MWEVAIAAMQEVQWCERWTKASPEERAAMLAQREKAEQRATEQRATEERRHREMIDALRESERRKLELEIGQSSSGFLVGMVAGCLLGKFL